MLECWNAGMLECWNAGIKNNAGIEYREDEMEEGGTFVQSVLGGLAEAG